MMMLKCNLPQKNIWCFKEKGIVQENWQYNVASSGDIDVKVLRTLEKFQPFMLS